ncbi:MAG: 16S rRNA (uracil(1498)-N(3))-methyltransferase [Micrococcales bacterium]|nr:16S rRNA (uracil(1498)-N(3))-methyltransferase [Micrococcales bacterium]
MTAPVFLAPPDVLATARPGLTVWTEGEEAHHALRVQRVKAGEEAILVDGRGRRVFGKAAVPDGSPFFFIDVTLVVDEPNPAAGVVLVQGLAKGGRDEMALEAAVGLGVETVIPWQAERAVTRWTPGKAEKHRKRWEAIARAEVKVGRRSWTPEILSVHSTAQLVDSMTKGGLLGARNVIVLDETATVPFTQVAGEFLATFAAEDVERKGLAIVVGPEGGITPEEVQALESAGARVARLWDAVLRSSIAGPAALAALATLRERTSF